MPFVGFVEHGRNFEQRGFPAGGIKIPSCNRGQGVDQ